jgi:MOSC domain-containing protein YiiM
MARLTGIFLGKEKSAGKVAVAEALLLADHGLAGDVHAGTHVSRHVSLFAQETLNTIQQEGFVVQPGQLSANLFYENLPPELLTTGQQFRIGDALLEIVEQRKPCRSITNIDYRLTKRLVGQCGQFARIWQGGTIRVGDTIELI